jgi:hypothetical protein
MQDEPSVEYYDRCKEPTLIAYSKAGYASKTWQLPADVQEVKEVSLARITPEGQESPGEAEVVDGRLVLRVGKEEALKVLVGK